MLINLAYLKKKWFTENPKYFKTKYDAKLNYFFLIVIILYMLYYCYTMSISLSKFYYTYNIEDTVKNSSSLDNY